MAPSLDYTEALDSEHSIWETWVKALLKQAIDTSTPRIFRKELPAALQARMRYRIRNSRSYFLQDMADSTSLLHSQIQFPAIPRPN